MWNLIQRTIYLQCTLYFCLFIWGVLRINDSRLYAERPPAPDLPELAVDLTNIPHAELIYMLSDEDYSTRLQSETLLLKLSHDELLELMPNFQEEELEVQLRFNRLLEHARLLKFQKLVERFLMADQNLDEALVPGWLEFKKLFPQANNLRKEYAEMIKNDYELFSNWQIEQNRDDVLACRCFDISLGLDSGMNNIPRNSSTIRSMLYLTSFPNIKVSSHVTNTLTFMVSNYINRTYRNPQQNNLIPNFTEIDRLLLNHWVAQADVIQDYNRFSIGNAYDLPGTLVLSKKMIASVTDGTRLHDPICCLARLGDNSYLPDLIALLKDERLAGPNFGNSTNTKKLPIQVRDIALACLVHKTNQKPAEYGFYNIQVNTKSLFNRYSTNFADENARSAAFNKWDAWAKQHLNDQGELVNKPQTKK